MAIVLAIEPDRRQAAHLAAIVRHQVHAELVIADTTEGALDAIGNRVPDLVLVPALLSPQDDAALAAALRVIAAAAHVRTLTIPVLASGVKRAPSGGMLAKWRKPRAASPEPDGCDPAVFGEQISAYLQEAAAERARLEEDALLDAERLEAGPTPNVDIPTAYDPPPPAVETFDSPLADSSLIAAPWSAPEPVIAFSASPADEPLFESAEALVRTEQQTEDGLMDEPLTDEALIDLSGDLEAISEHAANETNDEDAIAVYTIAADDGAAPLFDASPAFDDAPVFDLFDRVPGILEPPSIIEDVEAALDQIAAAARLRPEPVRGRRRSVAQVRAEAAGVQNAGAKSAASKAGIVSWVPMYLTPGRIWPALEGMPAETPAAHTEQPDWIELVASLRQDLERRRTEPPSGEDPIAARPSDGADAKLHRLVRTPRTHVRKAPVQDEWGFFDPERCGFSTLLAKLEEITEEDVRT